MNLPTKLTFLRIFMIPVFVVFFFIRLEAFPYFKFIALFFFALASFTDFLDGYIARKSNLVTTLGKFLDPIADKLLVSCALVAICLDTHFLQTGVAVSAMMILCRELLVSGFRIVASSKNVILAADNLGKIKTVFQMACMFFLIPYGDIALINAAAGKFFLITGFSLLIIAVIFTIISGVNYIYKNKEVLKDN